MQDILKKYGRFSFYTLLLSTLMAGVLLTSCEKDDDDERSDRIELLSYGPMPIARGAELRFIGNNLDKVTAIILPDNIEIAASQFTKRERSLLALIVPQNAVEGLVVLKTPQGDITTKTPIGFSEPISIESFSPGTIKPGSELTITGDYLNLVGEIIFTDRIAVDSSQFVSQSREELKLIVPAEAQTGIIALSNGAEDPIIIYSDEQLTVIVSTIESVTPNPVKAETELSIKGADLDLVVQIRFAGDQVVNADDFESQSDEEIVVVVPESAQDGVGSIVMASEIKVTFPEALTMAVPTISEVTPMTLKNGESISVSGDHLDLVIAVTFAGGVEGEIISHTESTMTIVTPETAITGEVLFHTRAEKSVSGGDIVFVDPVFTSFSPVEAQANNTVVITGENLDLVKNVWFTGNMQGEITAQGETEITVLIPVGSQSGKITLEALNGVMVESSSDFTILTNLPDITGYKQARAEPGKILTILGENMSLIKELVFPGGIFATAYGLKTETKVEVYVPAGVTIGEGQIRMITYEGEEGLLPTIFFGSVDPIYDPNLVFFDFNGTGKDSWWGNAINSGPEDNPDTSADGTPYWRVNGMSGTGWWDGLFFRNSSNNYSAEGVDVNTWAVRFDLKTFESFPTEGNLSVRLGGGGDTHFYDFNLNNAMGFADTNGWITVTLPLSGFLHESTGNPLSDAALGGSEFGMIWRSGVSVNVNIGIDNVRFEPIP
ncbi:glycan-binding surface protein [Natronoflexus pectinivorans]|uniref:IPT/TIG domain-containing protein n=1 Tax=Natronoflexus pectinivorans TaxID=682526 RepID=A0A4R2GNF8_9BACT|nr:glycan-binding surface protein [Natronoflexus pectinivorans]TCO10803.1 IPT/TIG domain-containing protein [Natronoflexus pectinivorans]